MSQHQFPDFMFDCESLGTEYDAPLISIGAVFFDITTGKLGETFYVELFLEHSLKCGKVSAATIAWWMRQDPKAQAIFHSDPAKKVSLPTALDQFNTFYRKNSMANVWCKGPAQDAAWLEHSMRYGAVGTRLPWQHWKVRDVRTIVDLAEKIAGFASIVVPNAGVAHHALDDAVYQASVISAAYLALDGARTGKSTAIKPTRTKGGIVVPAAMPVELVHGVPDDDDEL